MADKMKQIFEEAMKHPVGVKILEEWGKFYGNVQPWIDSILKNEKFYPFMVILLISAVSGLLIALVNATYGKMAHGTFLSLP